MLGLTIDKLLLVAVLAGLVVGPHRLPAYARQLARLIREVRRFVETSRVAAEREMGVSLDDLDWADPRRYDPRRMVRDALHEPTPSTASAEDARRVRPGQKFLVTGSAAHPHRIPIASLPADDPRRIAAGDVETDDRPAATADTADTGRVDP